MPATPSPSLLDNLCRELMRYPPFAQMRFEHVRQFAAAAREVYFACRRRWGR